MNSRNLPPLASWLAMPMEENARKAIERVRAAEDVAYIAVMPDVHLAGDVCVGTAMATRDLVYPSAVGGDIGCGMLALAFDASATLLHEPANAGLMLRKLREHIPIERRHRADTIALPADLNGAALSHGSLRAMMQSSGRLQVGTLGGGNHFIEFQADVEDRLWLMIHSGSRGVGQVVREYHLARATFRSASLAALDVRQEPGQDYLRDQEWARRFAHENRSAMARIVCELIAREFNTTTLASSRIICDHNHVQTETHFGQTWLVHRKGAMPAGQGQGGVVPGSMGTLSYVVEGRGCDASLRSSAHGAGRLLSRGAARERFSRADLHRQMEGIWYDPRAAEAMREESPGSYKDVRKVMRAQRELVKVTRILRPVLIYKGR